MLLNCGVGEDSWSPLDCKEIQPVNPKGIQSWIFTGRTDVEAETPNTLATWCKELTHLERLWCWERMKAGGEGDDRGWDGWMALLPQWTWVWVNSGNWWWTGRPAMLQSIGSQRVEQDWVTELNIVSEKKLFYFMEFQTIKYYIVSENRVSCIFPYNHLS